MPLRRLPPEIWREIIHQATYTPTCFDTSPHPDTWNPLSEEFIERYDANFRTKRALAFVSRQIHHITLEILCDVLVIESLDYDPVAGIVCRQLGGIIPLIPYLPATQHLLFDFTGLQKDQGYFDDVARSLEQIFRQCHNLRGLHLSFPAVGADELENSQSELHEVRASMQTQIAKAVCPGLQFLSIRGRFWEHLYENLLVRVSLTLRAHCMRALRNIDGFGGAAPAHHPDEIILPQLNSLHFSIFGRTNLSFSKFNMSALTYLVIGIHTPRTILTQILESARDSILTLRFDGRCLVDNDVLSIALTAPHLQFLGYRFRRSSVGWLSDQLCHNSLREISLVFDQRQSPLGTAEEIFRDHFRPISKRRFPMLSTIAFEPKLGHHHVRWVYNLEDGRRLEDGDTSDR